MSKEFVDDLAKMSSSKIEKTEDTISIRNFYMYICLFFSILLLASSVYFLINDCEYSIPSWLFFLFWSGLSFSISIYFYRMNKLHGEFLPYLSIENENINNLKQTILQREKIRCCIDNWVKKWEDAIVCIYLICDENSGLVIIVYNPGYSGLYKKIKENYEELKSVDVGIDLEVFSVASEEFIRIPESLFRSGMKYNPGGGWSCL
jgi:hypothetical protein